jgi:hypothetical protein
MQWLQLPNKHVKEHIKSWSDAVEKASSLPPSFSLDSTEITFNRLDVQLIAGSTPTWDYFVGKCGLNGNTLMAYIWSLLEQTNESQQYVILIGPGRDGKGALIRWLAKLFNDQLVGLSFSDSRWPALCVGKRIGVFNDLNVTTLPMSAAFKQITGRDEVTIDAKYEKAFSTVLDTKFILTTNKPLHVGSGDAERRRAIAIRISPDRTEIPGYEEKLWEERSAFLFKCKQAYQELYNSSTHIIRCDYNDFELETSSYEEPHQALFDRLFIEDPEASITANDFITNIQQVLGRKDNTLVGQFKDWLQNTYKINKVRESTGTRKWIYKGIRSKV